MKSATTRTNPAFKRTQPLPLLSADLAQRAGRAAMSLARAMPLADSWRAPEISLAGGAVALRPGSKVTATGFAG